MDGEMLQVLTPRQKEVCGMIIDGLTDKQIARKMGISPRTVEDHKHHIYSAMKVKNAVALVVKILRGEHGNHD